jgi:hypothetical protein
MSSGITMSLAHTSHASSMGTIFSTRLVCPSEDLIRVEIVPPHEADRSVPLPILIPSEIPMNPIALIRQKVLEALCENRPCPINANRRKVLAVRIVVLGYMLACAYILPLYI